MVNKVLLTR